MNQPTAGDGLAGTTAIVTGASRGFGRGIASALAAAGADVVGVARTSADLDDVHDRLGDRFTAVTADAADPATGPRLIDEYRLYFRPVVLGRGKPFFAGPRPPLRLVATDPVGEDAIRLTYIPA